VLLHPHFAPLTRGKVLHLATLFLSCSSPKNARNLVSLDGLFPTWFFRGWVQGPPTLMVDSCLMVRLFRSFCQPRLFRFGTSPWTPSRSKSGKAQKHSLRSPARPPKGGPPLAGEEPERIFSLEGRSGPAGPIMLAGAPVYRLPLRGSPYLCDLKRCFGMSPARVIFCFP